MKEPDLKQLDLGEDENHWDFKKIAIGGGIILVLLSLGALMLIPGDTRTKREKEGVLSVETEGDETKSQKPPPLPNREDVEGIISNAQDALSKITSDNLTSSQAAIQKVISDLEKLKDDKSATDVICDLVCKK